MRRFQLPGLLEAREDLFEHLLREHIDRVLHALLARVEKQVQEHVDHNWVKVELVVGFAELLKRDLDPHEGLLQHCEDDFGERLGDALTREQA